jgi:hypothetical protein
VTSGVQINLILAKSDFPNSTEMAGGNYGKLAERTPSPLSGALEATLSSSGLQRLLNPLNPQRALWVSPEPAAGMVGRLNLLQ